MTYEEIPAVLRAYMGAFEAYRKLGFRSDDIYVEVARSARRGGVLAVFATLRTQGKTFSIEVGDVPNPEKDPKGDALEKDWKIVCAAVEGGYVTQATLDRIWQESESCQDKMGLILALQRKGFFLDGKDQPS